MSRMCGDCDCTAPHSNGQGFIGKARQEWCTRIYVIKMEKRRKSATDYYILQPIHMFCCCSSYLFYELRVFSRLSVGIVLCHNIPK